MIPKKYRRLEKDSLIRNNFKRNELRRFKYNSSLHFLDNKYKYYIFFVYLRKFHLSSSLCRINSICVFSGRAH